MSIGLLSCNLIVVMTEAVSTVSKALEIDKIEYQRNVVL